MSDSLELAVDGSSCTSGRSAGNTSANRPSCGCWSRFAAEPGVDRLG